MKYTQTLMAGCLALAAGWGEPDAGVKTTLTLSGGPSFILRNYDPQTNPHQQAVGISGGMRGERLSLGAAYEQSWRYGESDYSVGGSLGWRLTSRMGIGYDAIVSDEPGFLARQKHVLGLGMHLLRYTDLSTSLSLSDYGEGVGAMGGLKLTQGTPAGIYGAYGFKLGRDSHDSLAQSHALRLGWQGCGDALDIALSGAVGDENDRDAESGRIISLRIIDASLPLRWQVAEAWVLRLSPQVSWIRNRALPNAGFVPHHAGFGAAVSYRF